MLKQLEEQLELLLKELEVARVKAVTIRQYVDSKIIRKSNYQLDYQQKFVLGWSKENKKVDIITLTVEGVEGKDFLYNEDISVLYFQEVWSYDDGYDIQCTCKGVTSNISITTA
jgi:galactitol-specific phosphotransferase system IIB component